MNYTAFVKSNNSSKDAESFAPSFGSANMCGVFGNADSCSTSKSYIAIITDIVLTMSVLLCLSVIIVINAIFAVSIIISLIAVIIINFNKLLKKQLTVECI